MEREGWWGKKGYREWIKKDGYTIFIYKRKREKERAYTREKR